MLVKQWSSDTADPQSSHQSFEPSFRTKDRMRAIHDLYDSNDIYDMQ